jgi:hypothetical protein
MSYRNKLGLHRIVPAIVFAGTLAGCADADLYLDRREFISLSAGDAVASNIIVQTRDPWPRASGNRNIPGNGDRMATAGERYRTGKVVTPQGLGTSSVNFTTQAGSGGGADAGQ